MDGYEWISFTTDYGELDGYVAACKGVLGRIAPAARVIDVTHQVPPQDVRRAARVLAQTVPWLPSAVHLAVVDPGVGTNRLGICLVAGRSVLVGPDNGLLVPAADALGGASAAYRLDDPAYQLPSVSRTFHGRDVFAPAAAHLSTGVLPGALGAGVPLESLVRLPAATVTVADGELAAEVLSVDGFGNVQLAATPADLAAAGLATGGRVTVHIGQIDRHTALGATFADVQPGELVVFVDSAGYVAVAVNGGSATLALAATAGDTMRLARAGGTGGGP